MEVDEDDESDATELKAASNGSTDGGSDDDDNQAVGSGLGSGLTDDDGVDGDMDGDIDIESLMLDPEALEALLDEDEMVQLDELMAMGDDEGES